MTSHWLVNIYTSIDSASQENLKLDKKCMWSSCIKYDASHKNMKIWRGHLLFNYRVPT